MAVNIPNSCEMDQIAITNTNIFHCKTLHNLPKLEFLAWKYTIWQPCSYPCVLTCLLHSTLSTDLAQVFPILMGCFREISCFKISDKVSKSIDEKARTKQAFMVPKVILLYTTTYQTVHATRNLLINLSKRWEKKLKVADVEMANYLMVLLHICIRQKMFATYRMNEKEGKKLVVPTATYNDRLEIQNIRS
jgi:hypothetical protein